MSAVAGERPILFSAPMVRAIINGDKTITRRILRLPPSLAGADLDVAWPDAALWGAAGCGGLHVQFGDASHRVRCPYGQPGDTLWVRESFRLPAAVDDLSPASVATKAIDAGYREPWCPTVYEADGGKSDSRRDPLFANDWVGGDGKLRPSIHMPRWASRLTLRVTSVRVERLQDITSEEAQAEGVEPVPVHGEWAGPRELGQHWSARKPFASLWDEINGDRGAWATNPWVWVVTFERIGGPS